MSVRGTDESFDILPLDYYPEPESQGGWRWLRTPEEVRGELLKLKGDITQFEETPEAAEFRQSSSSRAAPESRHPDVAEPQLANPPSPPDATVPEVRVGPRHRL